MVIIAAVATIVWWQRGRSTASASVLFRTTTLQRGDVTQTVTGSGSLSAITTVDVGAQVSGKIVKLHVDYNSPVKKDQLIAEVDPTSYQARLVQAEADLLSAQATLELRQLNAKRSAELLEKRLLSQSDYDTVVAELRQQEASTKKAEAAVNSARLDVEHCKITSPIDGVVLSRAVDVGQTVQSSMTAPTLYKLAQDLRQMQITASISEADIGGVAAGQAVQFSVDAFSGRTFEGKVREVRNNSTTTNNVVSYPTIITVDNSDLKLRPGMTANVTIYTARRTGVLRIANSALRFKVPAQVAVRSLAPANNNLQIPPANARNSLPDNDEKQAMREPPQARFASGQAPNGPPPFNKPPGTIPIPTPKILYVLTSPPDASGRATGELIATPVRVGISDSTSTEILEGAEEGDVVAIGTLSAQAAAASASTTTSSTTTTNPFAPQRPPGGGPPPR